MAVKKNVKKAAVAKKTVAAKKKIQARKQVQKKKEVEQKKVAAQTTPKPAPKPAVPTVTRRIIDGKDCTCTCKPKAEPAKKLAQIFSDDTFYGDNALF